MRAISTIIKNAQIAEGTLVLIFSPGLWYGFSELISLLPPSAKKHIIAVEYDDNLYSIAKSHMPDTQNESTASDSAAISKISDSNQLQTEQSVTLFGKNELNKLDDYIRQTVKNGQFRRVCRLDFCAGTSFAPDFYTMIYNAASELVTSFWMNRITLVKMGRLFAKNIFQNLKNADNGLCLSDLSQTVSTPILVCGAGESLDDTVISQKNIFTVAVDAALPSLLARGIRVDAVVSLESQYVIQKAYIGAPAKLSDQKKLPLLFADLASRPSVVRSIKNTTVWFASEYAQINFLDKLKQSSIVQQYIPPLGSVGLAAVYIALILRKSSDIPVFVTGLDFSYSTGKTHAKHTPAHINMLISCERSHPIGNYAASFSETAISVTDKSSRQMITGKAMSSYAQVFRAMFAKTNNLFDLGKCGIDLGLVRCTNEQFTDFEKKITGCNINEVWQTIQKKLDAKAADSEEKIQDFLNTEKKSLEKVRDLLINADKSSFRDTSVSLSKQLYELLKDREYLYLHFPDGYALSTEVNFLKRVRAEIDFFLKQINSSAS